ncbi:MAG: GNAT family N-acetyltransferase [Myxococcota bacterium]
MKQDFKALLTLHRKLYIDHRNQILSPEEREASDYVDFETVLHDDMRSMLSNNQYIILIAEDRLSPSFRPLGYASARVRFEAGRTLPKRATLEDWYVVTDLRKLGLGRALIDALRKVLCEQKVQVLESSTWLANQGARTAHHRAGFTETRILYRMRLDQTV